MTFPESCQYLNSFINYELFLNRVVSADFSLDRFRELLRAIGSPETKICSIHIAGTKGKGSTAAFTAEILRSLGFRVGLYTSPHLWDVRERIRLLEPGRNRRAGADLFPDCISKRDFCALLAMLKPRLEEASRSASGPPTYFEILTALGFCYFVKRKADYVVLETGLGGRLDATNVVVSLACGITPISLEHTQILGNTLSKIAREKAAIIKKSCPVVVAPQEKQALAVINERVQRMKAKPLYIGKDIRWQVLKQNAVGQNFIVSTPSQTYRLRTSLLGEHQCPNAGMAIALIESLPGVSDRLTEKVVARAISRTVLPGRFEIIRRKPYIILDVAHTPESVARVGKTIRQIFPKKKIVTILGLAQDKDQRHIIQNILAFTQGLILTKARHPRAADLGGKTTGLTRTVPISSTASVAAALNLALTKVGKDDVILVVGSFHVVAEAKQCLAFSG